jgi:hypothetical protein
MTRFGRHTTNGGAAEAVRAAEQSHAQAVDDRVRAARTRAVAEQLEAQVRQHNTANRYDSFLQRLTQEGRN